MPNPALRTRRWLAGACTVVVLAGGAQAQTARPAAADAAARTRSNLSIMEGVLERAVVLGADSLNRRVKVLAPQDPPLLLAGEADVRGFRLDGYGVFFDVEVPMLRQSVAWSLRARLEQNGVPVAAALDQLRSYVRSATDARTRQSLEQALQRLELQVSSPENGAATGGRAVSSAEVAWLSDPNAAYTAAVKGALIDAMLEHSQALGLAPGEWLTVAARDNESRAHVPGEDRTTVTLRIKGSDLAALRAGQISPEEARRRVEIREQ